MPRSIFLGRPMPHPGEPLFLLADTAAAMALAEEEDDTCRKCGLPRVWCRDNKKGRARFDVAEDFCWATYRVALRQDKQGKEKVSAATREATLLSAGFREGYEPQITDGLGISPESDAS